MKVTKQFWANAVSTTYFLIDHIPSSVLNSDIPYTILFPSKSLFPIESRVFGSICFVRDVRPQVTKLDLKFLKCIFLGYSRHKKGYRCFSPTLNRYLVSADVDSTPFFSTSSMSEGQGEDDDFLVYTIQQASTPPQSVPADISPSVHPSQVAPKAPTIIQVYSRRSSSLDSTPLPSSVSEDPAPSTASESDLDLPIALRKGKRTCTYPISSFVCYDHLSSSTRCFVTSLDSIFVPKTIVKALSHPG